MVISILHKKGGLVNPPNNFNVSDSLVVDTTTITESPVRLFAFYTTGRILNTTI